MRALRRAALALGVAGAIASALRMAIRRPSPDSAGPAEGVWRELSGPDLT